MIETNDDVLLENEQIIEEVEELELIPSNEEIEEYIKMLPQNVEDEGVVND